MKSIAEDKVIYSTFSNILRQLLKYFTTERRAGSEDHDAGIAIETSRIYFNGDHFITLNTQIFSVLSTAPHFFVEHMKDIEELAHVSAI